MIHHAGTTRSARRRAFTLVELMVVIGLILVLIAVTVPAVGRIIESANYSAAVNTVVGTLGNARALAMRSGRETGVAFLFDTRTETCSLVVIERAGAAGSLTDAPSDAGSPAANAMIFYPALGSVPQTLPAGTAVLGLSFNLPPWDAPRIDRISGGTSQWYAGEAVPPDPDSAPSGAPDVPPWLFPRNDPWLFLERSLGYVDPWLDDAGRVSMSSSDRVRAVRHAHSFCVIFGPGGSVVDIASVGTYRLENAYLEFRDQPQRVNDADGAIVVYDDPGRFDPEVTRDYFTGQDATATGSRNPEVVLRSAQQLAVVDLGRLASGAGAAKPWLLHSSRSQQPWPDYVDDGGQTLGDAELDNAVRRMSRWVDENAVVLSFDRYTGNVLQR